MSNLLFKVRIQRVERRVQDTAQSVAFSGEVLHIHVTKTTTLLDNGELLLLHWRKLQTLDMTTELPLYDILSPHNVKILHSDFMLLISICWIKVHYSAMRNRKARDKENIFQH